MVKSIACILITVAAYGQEYKLTDLGLGSAQDVNQSGKIVGNADTGGWFFDGTSRDTLKFGAHFVGATVDLFFTANTANAIDDADQITGAIMFIPNSLSSKIAYLHNASATILLGSGEGFGINSGLVVGNGFVFDGAYKPLAANGTLQSINSSKIAAGSRSMQGVDGTEGVLFDVSTQSYQLVAGLPPNSVINRINNQGVAVGHVESGANHTAFVAEQHTPVFLGTLGGTSSSAKGISNPGLIVGTSTVADGTDHAFVYNDIMMDLNRQIADFGWVLNSANAVNDNGWIVGTGTRNGVQRAFLLKPTSVRVVAKTNEFSIDVYAGLKIKAASGKVRIDVVDEAGQSWRPLTNLTFSGGSTFWVDQDPKPRRYYRVVKQ